MAPDSLTVELIAAATMVVAAVLAGPLWTRARGGRAVPYRAGAVLLAVLTTAAFGLSVVNRQVDAFPTWSALLGGTAEAAGPAPVATTRDGGRVVSLTVPGPASGLTLPMYAYLPPGYDPHGALRYPVIEALHGYPGSPLQWFRKLDVATTLDREIDAGRMTPAVVLFPLQTPDPSRDTECTDLVGGPHTETFLTTDVPAYARAHLRVRPGGWGLIGYSAGGYCAANLLLRHPGPYVAGASLSGYSQPGIAIGDGSEHTTYDDVWRLHHLPVPAVALYLACARTDRAAMRSTAALAGAARAPLSVTTAYLASGGHNDQTWLAMSAPAFDWLAGHLPRPAPDAT